MQRKATLLALFSCLAVSLFAQDRGLGSKQSKDDWEEINYEFNSAVLTDGFPSLLRLADLLKQHTDYKVRVTGHTDVIGSNRYNERLGQRRAETVRDFLVKYGAAAGQVSIETRGKAEPEQGGNTREKHARWVNRRVTMTVTDGQGRTVGAGTIAETLKEMGDMPKKCCDDILARLDKLDDILKKLDALNDANAGLRRDLGAVKSDVDRLKGDVANVGTEVAKRPTNDQVTDIVDKESYAQIKRSRDPRFSLLGMNAGVDDVGNLTFSGKGRYFAPVGKLFGENFAVQAQGEYLYYRGQKEGQFDLGLVNRIGNFQAGLFSSFKHVTLANMQSGGTMGQGALTLDFLFPRGKVGFFGTKGFLDGGVLNRANLTRNGVLFNNLFTEQYVSIIDQVGLSTTVGLFGNSYLEGNVGYLKSRGNADRPGGTLRFIQPLSDRVAVTVEGNLNETLLSRYQTTSVRAGLQLGNFIKPKDFTGMVGPVPVDVPKVRYEVLSRTVRTGATPPVADAGPDQNGVAAGTITLNGTGSYDPEGLALTYAWTQISGPSVALNGANTATPSFTAVAGTTYSFRLTVTNTLGLSAQARTNVSTAAAARVQIQSFVANPPVINAGQSSALTWSVLNADTVTIDTIGSVNRTSGSVSVQPTVTTTYRLTARNSTSEDNATVTVTVNQPQTLPATIIAFSGNPSTITAGQSSTLLCQTQNATQVSISGVGNVGTGGSTTVSPTQTTTYTCTATGANGQTATATTTITVNQTQPTAPVISGFTATPPSITAGQSSNLLCTATGASTIVITGGGATVGSGGTATVSPTQTTTYTCTATNTGGQSVTSQVTVTVTPTQPTNPVIASFTANPAVITVGGSSTLTWATTNATTVTITPTVGTVQPNGSATVTPTQTTTYTLTASNAAGQTATATATVTVNPVPPPAFSVTNCVANPTASPSAGSPVVLSYQTTGAVRVFINNLPSVTNLPLSGSVTVNPTVNTTYSLVATAANGATAGCTFAVTIRAATPGAPPTAIITGPQLIETPYRQITLDASQSTNPGGGPLTYTWSAIGTGAAILDQGQPTTRIQLGGLFGDYIIQLTVTNAAGQSASTTVTVRFVSTKIP